MGKANLISKKYADRNIREIDIQIGDKILLKGSPRAAKLDAVWLGPYEVIKKHNNMNIEIKQGNKIRRIHLNQVKKYFE